MTLGEGVKGGALASSKILSVSTQLSQSTASTLVETILLCMGLFSTFLFSQPQPGRGEQHSDPIHPGSRFMRTVHARGT